MTKPLQVLRLEYRDTPGTGKEIYAHLNRDESFVEVKTRNQMAPVLQTEAVCRHLGYEPWIQFPSQQWDDMLESVLKEMVQLWNDKHKPDQPGDGLFD